MAYKARNKIGRFADESEVDAPLPLDLKCEARVKVMPTNPRDIERVGTIRYVGKVDFAIGSWVGIEYDEPVGKNDGTVEGKQYFQCQSKYGGFVKPERCAVRDWQSLDDELDFDSD
jgi:tubulin-folding cofactor B